MRWVGSRGCRRRGVHGLPTGGIEALPRPAGHNFRRARGRTRVEHGSGAVSYYTYDAASRLTNITHRKSNDSVIASFDYAHDPVGNPIRMTLANGDTCYYGYDDVYEPTSEVRLDIGDPEVYTQYFTYDPAGNRTKPEPCGTGPLPVWGS